MSRMMVHCSLASLHGQDVGSPEKLITGFAPELFGVPIAEEDVLETASVDKDGHRYYQWCVFNRGTKQALRKVLRNVGCFTPPKPTSRRPNPPCFLAVRGKMKWSGCNACPRHWLCYLCMDSALDVTGEGSIVSLTTGAV